MTHLFAVQKYGKIDSDPKSKRVVLSQPNIHILCENTHPISRVFWANYPHNKNRCLKTFNSVTMTTELRHKTPSSVRSTSNKMLIKMRRHRRDMTFCKLCHFLVPLMSKKKKFLQPSKRASLQFFFLCFALNNFSLYFFIPSEIGPCSFVFRGLPWQSLPWFTPLCRGISFAEPFNFAAPWSAVKWCGVRGKERAGTSLPDFPHPCEQYRRIEGVKLSLVMYCGAKESCRYLTPRQTPEYGVSANAWTKISGFSCLYFWSASSTLAVSFMEARSGESPRHLGISRMRDGECREAISCLINDGSARTWRDDRHVSLAFLSPLPLLRRGTQRRRKVLIDLGLRSWDPHSRSLQKGGAFFRLFVLSGFLSFPGRKICDSSPPFYRRMSLIVRDSHGNACTKECLHHVEETLRPALSTRTWMCLKTRFFIIWLMIFKNIKTSCTHQEHFKIISSTCSHMCRLSGDVELMRIQEVAL